MADKTSTRGDNMNVWAAKYDITEQVMTSVLSNSKMNLTDEQKTTFQDILADTMKNVTKATAASSQNNGIWKSIGAFGMDSSGYSDLLMTGLLGGSGGNMNNPYYGLLNQVNNRSHLYSGLTMNNYATSAYTKQMNTTGLNSIYERINSIQSKW